MITRAYAARSPSACASPPAMAGLARAPTAQTVLSAPSARPCPMRARSAPSEHSGYASTQIGAWAVWIAISIST